MSRAGNEPVSNWLFYAHSDLRAAKLSFNEGIWHEVTFLSQQSAEKSLKAVILQAESKVPRIHTIKKLLDLSGLGDEKTRKMAILLDKFYVLSRYPDALPGSIKGNLPAKEDAKEALESAQEFFDLAVNTTKLFPTEV